MSASPTMNRPYNSKITESIGIAIIARATPWGFALSRKTLSS